MKSLIDQLAARVSAGPDSATPNRIESRRLPGPDAGPGPRRQLARAFNDIDWHRGLKVAKGIAAQLDDKHPSAAASLREGLEDMFTVRRLDVSDRPARSLSCTNAVESMISVVRTLTDRASIPVKTTTRSG